MATYFDTPLLTLDVVFTGGNYAVNGNTINGNVLITTHLSILENDCQCSDLVDTSSSCASKENTICDTNPGVCARTCCVKDLWAFPMKDCPLLDYEFQKIGIEDVIVVPDTTGTYIDHIDTHLKFISDDTVLLRRVPPSNSMYSLTEELAKFLSTMFTVVSILQTTKRMRTRLY